MLFRSSSTGSHPTPGFDLCSHSVVAPSHAGLFPRRLANWSSATMSVSDWASASAIGLGAAAVAADCGSVDSQQNRSKRQESRGSTFYANANVDFWLNMHMLYRDGSRLSHLCSDRLCLCVGLVNCIVYSAGDCDCLLLRQRALDSRRSGGERGRCVAPPSE